MQDRQLSVNDVINSLTRQIAEQAQKIALLEATVNSLTTEPATLTVTDTENPEQSDDSDAQ